MKDTPKPDKRRKCATALRAKALRLAEQSCSAQTATHALNIDPKRIYQGQKAAQTPAAAASGAALDPGMAAEPHQLRALAQRYAQELEILKNHCQHSLEAQALADAGPMSHYRFVTAERGATPCGGFHAWMADEQRAMEPKRPLGKQRWSRFSAPPPPLRYPPTADGPA